MSEPVKILIEIDGGIVAGVYAGGVPVQFVIVDYDTDGADPRDLRKVDGVAAFVTGGDAFADGLAVEKAHAAWDAPATK